MVETIGLGSSPFARRYLGSRFYFPFLQLLRCFSSLGWLAPAYSIQLAVQRVAPFGNSRIKACFQLPETYRR